MSRLPAVELLPPTAGGRVFQAERPVRLGDVDPGARLRLDATARYLQDVAGDDADDALDDAAHGWLARRTLIEVNDPPVARDRLVLTTFCTGAGRSWAERRTSIARRHDDEPPGTSPALVEAVSLWVCVDVATGRPARLTDDFDAAWGTAANGRAVSAKLSLPARPGDDARSRPWSFRRADLDPFDHVNNAAQWSAIEELVQTLGLPRRGRGEIEFLAPITIDDDVTLSWQTDPTGGFDAWLHSDDRPLAAIRWRPA